MYVRTAAYLILLLVYLALCLVGIYKYRCLDKSQKILLAAFIITFGVELASFISAYIIGSSLYLFHFFTPVYYSLVALAFAEWQKKPNIKLIIRLSVPVYIISSLYFSFNQQSIMTFDVANVVIVSSLFILISIMTLANTNEMPRYILFSSIGLFAFSAGTIIYYILMMAGYYSRANSIIHNFANIAGYTLFIFAYIRSDKVKHTSNDEQYIPNSESRVDFIDNNVEREVNLDNPILRLSPREYEVAVMIKAGLTIKEIAANLSIQQTTVAQNVKNIRKKLEIKERGVNLRT
jgi:DNA-binding CsgD family transcriptional regulator